ncbi:MAG: signal peptidase I [Truepera sp.]|nr:signal peptidase I [Truepera sp.]MBS3967138.1 signal peptidase I [Truepera sp.]
MLQATPQKRQTLWRRTVRPLLEAVVVAGLFVTFIATTVGISGDSMTPTLHHGERALVPKYETWLRRLGLGQFQRGDIVYFRPPEGVPEARIELPLGLGYRSYFIKRIIGLPGDRLRLEHGVVYLNGEVLVEPYLAELGSSNLAEITVPKGHVFVLGDQRGPFGSVDSRRFGPIPLESLSGRTTVVIWPLLVRDNGQWRLNLRLL